MKEKTVAFDGFEHAATRARRKRMHSNDIGMKRETTDACTSRIGSRVCDDTRVHAPTSRFRGIHSRRDRGAFATVDATTRAEARPVCLVVSCSRV